MKKLLTLFSSLVIILLISGCSNNSTNSISVSGSTSVDSLMSEVYAIRYEAITGTVVEYQAIGSTGGVENAISGTTTFGTTSRELKQEEIDSGLAYENIAYDGIAIVTHPSNPVENLTFDQVYGIFTGEITNWSEVGGDDAEIVVVSREAGSGTRRAFEDILGYGEGGDIPLTKNAIIKDGNGNVQSTVANNSQAIGYVSFSYIDETVKSLTIDGIEPNEENVISGTYSISRPFVLCWMPENLSEEDQAFLDWVLTDAQMYNTEAGVMPVN